MTTLLGASAVEIAETRQDSEESAAQNFDARAFRDAMSQFVTGVTVVAADDGARAHAITANSFTSVSLDPPLVLVCVGLQSSLVPILRAAGRFSVSVLAASARETAATCAAGSAEARRALLVRRGADARPSAPRLAEAAAWFDCALQAEHPGGDHGIFVGRVEALSVDPAKPPLVWWRGGFVDPPQGG